MLFIVFFFFFNDTATTEIYTLSLHDALPIWRDQTGRHDSPAHLRAGGRNPRDPIGCRADRKSTRLNSSHSQNSYAVFCLKKKKKKTTSNTHTLRSYNHSPVHTYTRSLPATSA